MTCLGSTQDVLYLPFKSIEHGEVFQQATLLHPEGIQFLPHGQMTAKVSSVQGSCLYQSNATYVNIYIYHRVWIYAPKGMQHICSTIEISWTNWKQRGTLGNEAMKIISEERMHFNTANRGTGRDDLAPVCRKTAGHGWKWIINGSAPSC